MIDRSNYVISTQNIKSYRVTEQSDAEKADRYLKAERIKRELLEQCVEDKAAKALARAIGDECIAEWVREKIIDRADAMAMVSLNRAIVFLDDKDYARALKVLWH